MTARRVAYSTGIIAFAACVIACGGAGTSSKPGTAQNQEKPGERVEGLGNAATIDGMEVVIRRAIIEPASLDMGGDRLGFSVEKELILLIAIRSTDPKKTFEYRGWTGNGAERHVTDDRGNTYPHVRYSNGRPVGQIARATTVGSDKTVLDVLVVNRPFPVAGLLDIDLPAPFDRNKVFRFRIQTADITRPE